MPRYDNEAWSGWKDCNAMLRSAAYLESRRKVFRQLIEALLYEEIIEPQLSGPHDAVRHYAIPGRDELGEHVSYHCTGRRLLGFGRVRLTGTVMRGSRGEEEEADDLAIFMAEIAPFLKETPQHLAGFVSELEQTLLKDAAARYRRSLIGPAPAKRSCADLEGDVLDAHPYHPCFKSRIGFDLEDNASFGPEFHPSFALLWIAVHRDAVELALSTSLDETGFFKGELGESLHERFVRKLADGGKEPPHYRFMPVHPWQWNNLLPGLFFRYIHDGTIVPLGAGEDVYSPQQSIRTLSNRTNPARCHVKASLSILNTSALRIIGAHHAANAPALSDWLGSVVDGDPYLKEELRLLLLKEVAGMSFRYELLPETVRQRALGTLGVIWRESVDAHLVSGEEAIPFTALCHVLEDGRPFIADWVSRRGVEHWLKRLLHVAMRPLLHLLFAHGIAMESHGQNMVLIHKNGEPSRIALRDLPGGVRFYDRAAWGASRPGGLREAVSHHPNSYSTSAMETDQASKVRNFLMDSFLQISLAALSVFMEEQYSYDERSFWGLVAEEIRDYQRSFPEFQRQFDMFDLFTESIKVGELTKRRLFGEQVTRDHEVTNPLAIIIREEKDGADIEQRGAAI
ncbi:IucA/IucC family siderophore biosynthesis protein [Paenibacillus oenotherae]|uniref:IucA/IucC family siderophore biosynthesis protein n=1 Tax=Paenibacillus oenotherae TaxID=1435645 RepID=A0ABS7D0B3_9BACL|nr:IucA/IucC family protein [Paenibacillus oenotherae]MBW7473359.1 IucA/IucC family siderophore biosynthesis protein [Paenibacillus oenotherae]